MFRFLIACLLPLFLLGCGAQPVWAPDEDVARAAYRDKAPPSITLYTMVNNRSGAGGHSALLINASQRVIFDPAGSWWHRLAPERNDVIYGITPTMLDFYIDYHARETYHVVEQTLQVSPELAEQALRIVEGYGAVPKAMCARSTSDVLNRLPGFESIPHTLRPIKMMEAFANLPGVTSRKIYDDDPDEHEELLREQQRARFDKLVEGIAEGR
ncbi:hypothetical protein [Rhodovulum sulfidophilum]|uniref:hypothetical protein n=1 Tax=Rhodovulum sulfidophilum TaxID=35806 RepID=UPI001F2B8C2C|nr:hypothetical protein [Rhodovulum sulfidophilum]MCE8441721.1 hypothetical protein [Rhodovulum sulfidophilum]MCE8467906.1 hypothetical protein [Rhodovulum sulfidophilum]